MAELKYDETTLHLSFSRWEAPFVRRSGMAVPLSAIEAVDVLPGWSSEILGLRSGLAISGYLKVGIFLHPSGIKRLVVMKRGNPVLRIGLHRDTQFDELLLSSPNAYGIADALRPAGIR
ncbi:hypothetical protein [Rhodococcus phenolicus]|uniref:hypothetical protein n=1 Tax=Rhodococcus phenolicus TaxID=263849 RepID=UPI00082EBE85|nr:hypothetical protein [Rhodococcus phenolicus]